MNNLFTAEYWILWALLLTVSLFYFVRKLIWILLVRRAAEKITEQKKTNKNIEDLTDNEINRLKRRAGVTAILLSFVFSFVYVSWLFRIGS